jgi:hypothetical protein
MLELNFKLWLEGMVSFIPAEEFMQRLEKVGWHTRDNKRKSEVMYLAPDGINKLTIAQHNWVKNWNNGNKSKQELRRIYGHNLDFLYETPFSIPKNFNIRQQKTIIPVQTIFVSAIRDLNSLGNKEIFFNNAWKGVEAVDFSSDGTGLFIMFNDGTSTTFPYRSEINIRDT